MVRRSTYLYEFGPFRLDAAERLLSRDGEAVPLSPKAFDLLLAMVERHGRLIEKDDLMRLERAGGAGANVSAPEPTEAPGAELEPVGGAMPLDSQFYIVRPVDEQFRLAIARRDSIVLVKGARQVGKTSLLARGLQQAREAGSRIILTDLQMLNEADLASVETLFLALGELIAYRLDLNVRPREVWDPLHSPNFNFERYLQRHAVAEDSAQIVWGVDEEAIHFI